MGVKKVLAIVGITLALLVAAAGVAVYVLSRTPELEPYHNGVNTDARDLQTQMGIALMAAGVESPLVIIEGDTAHAMYELPTWDATRDADAWQRVVLGALAPLASEGHLLAATQYVDGAATSEWRVEAEKVLAYESGALTALDLEAAVVKTSL